MRVELINASKLIKLVKQCGNELIFKMHKACRPHTLRSDYGFAEALGLPRLQSFELGKSFLTQART